MIIEKFEEQVQAFPTKIAVKAGNRTITYRELNTYANEVASIIRAGCQDLDKKADSSCQRISLLFEHGADMIIGVMGALKAGKTYVPLDVTYPSKRLLYMLENSDSYLILTNESNLQGATQLAAQAQAKIDVLNINPVVSQKAEGENALNMNTNAKFASSLNVNSDTPAYILYTSGTTGRPKGVVQTQRNVLYYTRNWIQRFSITDSDRMTLFSAFSHDGSVQDMFAALLAGATLYPYNIKTTDSTNPLYTLIMKEKITIWHSVPTLFRYFVNTLTEKNVFYDIRWVLLGGEPLRPNDLELFRAHFPNATLADVYGQTESSVSTICSISQTDISDAVCLGEPLDETEILLVAEDGDVIETMGMGEIVVACDYIAPGYWRDEESTKRVFSHDDEMGRLYWTGDLGRLTMDGLIKVMGRKDSQIKIRGFRVETGEIESVLLQHEAVKEAVAIAKEDGNIDNYLCVYFVSDKPIPSEEFREYLSRELPAYMIPRYFIPLEKMPLTPNGKIDRQRLPEQNEAMIAESVYVVPSGKIEKELAAIWQEVLGVEKVGINDNFIELGGHSLQVISIISRIHQEFDVELQLNDVLSNPTIKKLSSLVMEAKPTLFSPIELVENQDYYNATPDQERMYILSQYEGIGNTYNLPYLVKLAGKIDYQQFQEISRQLIKRHEVLRTSFEIVDGKVIQRIHPDFDFQVMYIDAEKNGLNSPENIRKIIDNFIRPFDLTQVPLIRMGLIKLSEDTYLVLQDLPHIIADGISCSIFINEFVKLYLGKKLPQLKLRYRDYSEWQNQLLHSPKVMRQEEYWRNRFKGKIPVLNLPTDYPRPAVQSFEGDIFHFTIGKEITRRLNQLGRETGTRLYIVLMAIYTILLHKYTSQEDIVVGSLMAGRNYVDLENIIGYFVKTLPLRNYPVSHKTFLSFLDEVKNDTLNAFENQLYPLSSLLETLNIKRYPGRNPLIDAVFIMQSSPMLVKEKEDSPADIPLKVKAYEREIKTAMFDLNFEVFEKGEEIACCFQYCTKLFARDTIELMKDRLLSLIENILTNPQAKIQDLDFAVPIEKEMSQVEEVEFDL